MSNFKRGDVKEGGCRRRVSFRDFVEMVLGIVSQNIVPVVQEISRSCNRQIQWMLVIVNLRYLSKCMRSCGQVRISAGGPRDWVCEAGHARLTSLLSNRHSFQSTEENFVLLDSIAQHSVTTSQSHDLFSWGCPRSSSRKPYSIDPPLE